ncbi:MAG: acyl carrier protein [Syntrophomonas sp.]|nr:acyl carrier protein [Syntrophomonas sp.]
MQRMLDLARSILAEQLNINAGQITAETTFSDLEADDVNVTALMTELGEVYDIEFPEYDLEYYPTLESLVASLYEYMQEAQNE